jgi:glycosyltransferase involved in cell wall biosynthesis
MRVALLIRSLDYGGTESQLVALAVGLHKIGHSVKVFKFYPKGFLENELVESKVEVISLGKKSRWDIFNFLLRFIRQLRNINPDVLYAFNGVPNILTVIIKPLFPKIKFVWGVRSSELDLSYYDRVSRFLIRIEGLLSKYSDQIIVNSYAGYNHAIKRGFPEKKMLVIQNGIDTKRFYIDNQKRNRLRSDWEIANNQKLIGLVGRFDPLKDHQTFLMAASHLAENFEDVRFVLIGDGPGDYRKKLEELSSDLQLMKKLIWAGASIDMTSVYNALDIIVSSSSSEGFSNVICEAMACGVYPVVTDVGDSRMIVGDIGKVVIPRDPLALAEGLKVALAEIKEINPERTRKRIVDNFGLSVMIEKTERVLLELTE